LGAGLTGLAAALASEKAGIRYRLFEREREPGGLARTLSEAGYRFDRTGHLLHVRDSELESEIREWLGDEYRVLDRRSRIWSHGVYTEYPFQANTFGLPPEVAFECVMGFLEARERARTSPPANFEEFCLAHFGTGISRHFMLPYNARLWGVPAREITAQWCDRFVPLPRLEDVIGGALGVPQRRLGYNQEFIYPASGIGALPRALERQVRGVELSMAPTRIDWENRRLCFGEETVPYDRLLSSIPLDRVLELCQPLPDDMRQIPTLLRCTRLYYLDVALNAPVQQDWHWAYVPEQKYPFYRVGCYSNFSECMAPPGCANLYVELVDRNPPDLAMLLPAVTKALIEMRVIPGPQAIEFARVRSLEHAYVIFDANHEAATKKAHAYLREHGIVSVGRYGEWTYSSMEDALHSGRRAIAEIERG
jgi:protoporphyrinogen oxidase